MVATEDGTFVVEGKQTLPAQFCNTLIGSLLRWNLPQANLRQIPAGPATERGGASWYNPAQGRLRPQGLQDLCFQVVAN